MTDREGAPPCGCILSPYNPRSLDYLGPDIPPKRLAENRAGKRHRSENQ